jgi:hypothetical protein
MKIGVARVPQARNPPADRRATLSEAVRRTERSIVTVFADLPGCRVESYITPQVPRRKGSVGNGQNDESTRSTSGDRRAGTDELGQTKPKADDSRLAPRTRGRQEWPDA